MSTWQATDIVGVSTRSIRNGICFRVQGGGRYLGICSTRREAIQLLKDNDVEVNISRDEEAEVELFKKLIQIFGNWKPTDYKSHAKCLGDPKKAVIQFYPAVYGAFIRGKEFEFRHFLVRWFLLLSKSRRASLHCIVAQNSKLRDEGCREFFHGIRSVCVKMEAVDRTWSNRHINTKVSHHSGWIMLCLGLRVLTTCASGGHHYGNPGLRYKYLAFTPEAAKAIALLHKTQTIFSLHDAPEDAVGYGKAVRSMEVGLHSLLQNVGAIADPTSYRFLWNARATLEGARFAAKTTRFMVHTSMTVNAFQILFLTKMNTCYVGRSTSALRRSRPLRHH